MTGRITQVHTNAACAGDDGTYVSTVFAYDMGQTNRSRFKVSGVYVNMMGLYPLNTGNPLALGANQFTQVYAQVMIPHTPNFEWIEMFIDEVFPYDISYNSIGATRFMTDVAIVDSGHDQRASRWSQPLMEFDIAYGVRTLEHLHGLIAFFRAMAGRKNAFLYQDVMDNSSTMATEIEARRAPNTGWGDQKIGVADHSTYQFQLVKTYDTPSGVSTPQVRPIYKPKAGSVQIAVDAQEVFNFEVNTSSGVITFVTNLTKTLDDMDIVETEEDSGLWVISGPSGWTEGFNVGDKIQQSGWLNSANNNTYGNDVSIHAITSDTMTVNPVEIEYGAEETSRDGVTIRRHPAPKTGDITAGYHFYVPVRFDTDRLPTSLEHYGIGGAADVKLIEVRPVEEWL